MKRLLTIFLLTYGFHGFAQPVVAGFTLNDVTSGNPVPLDQYSDRPALVVIFTSNECPFDNYYTDRIASLVNQYGSKVPILLVNAHPDAPESEENMKKKAAAWSFRVPYLADKNQAAMETLGARRSPEAFLLKPTKGGFTVAYNGAIDDNPQTPGSVTTQYLRDAIENILAGKPAPAPVRAAGCSIRRK